MSRWSTRLGVVIVAAWAAFVTCGTRPADGDTRLQDLYFRDTGSIPDTVKLLLARAAYHGHDAVTVVFDLVTFDPPPGRTEFVTDHRYRDDLLPWIEALEAAAPRASRPLFAAVTTSVAPVRVGDFGWRAEVRRELDVEWWDDRAFREFQPAARWAERLCARTPGKRPLLALVTGDVLPEQWAHSGQRDNGQRDDERWRRKLSPIGEYWDEESVASAVRNANGSLTVVAPQSRFGDFLPVGDIPEAPWASRPILPPVTEIRVPENVEGPDVLPRSVFWLRRFTSNTPLWCRRYGGELFFNTDVPSGYGWWPFARAAAATDGEYLFYPFQKVEWLDVCPRDGNVLNALGPELVPRAAWIALRQGDEVLAALIAATRIVEDATPWNSGSHGGRASGWIGFDSVSPPRLAKQWRPRQKPWDEPIAGPRTVASWKREGGKLATLVPLYDDALRVLDRAERDFAAGRLKSTCPRSVANLRLTRFWFEMSAFHLEALSIYLRELERFVPPDVRASDGEVVITYVPAIKMSDCLAAYDGRELPPDEDLDLQRDADRMRGFLAARDDLPRGLQDDLLPIPQEDARYRARRALPYVFRRLDPRLVGRATAMVDAGEVVMDRYARSGWGWVVYYSVAYTFVWQPVPPGDSIVDRFGGADPPPGGPPTK